MHHVTYRSHQMQKHMFGVNVSLHSFCGILTEAT
jgi:hypothetical protein